MDRVYGNVGVLDIRNTSEEVFKDKIKIGNVGMVLYSKQTSHLLKHISAGNIGSITECEDDVQLIQGKSVLGSESLKDLKSPLRLLVMGKLVIQDNTSIEAFEKGVASLHVSGKILCPSDLLPVVQAKALSLNGKIETYPSGYRLIEKSIRYSKVQLSALEPNSKLAIMGDLGFESDVTPELLKERISSLFVKGKLSAFEGLLSSIQERLHSSSSTLLNMIPNGYEYIADDVFVGTSELLLWSGAKLFFNGSVQFASDVSDKDIANIETFLASDIVYCRESLLPALVKKCDRFKTKFSLYKERLFLNDGQSEITKAYLTQGKGSVSIINHGVLTFDEKISIEDIGEKVDAIKNFGVLMVDDAIMGAIQEKVKEASGPILSNKNEVDSGDSDKAAGNIGVLKL
ncbi:MAG: hypothetical protein M9962_07955 [Oligoflexia bacterium]|nr:hypothetical protein [Oligoflexia bacterium]